MAHPVRLIKVNHISMYKYRICYRNFRTHITFIAIQVKRDKRLTLCCQLVIRYLSLVWCLQRVCGPVLSDQGPDTVFPNIVHTVDVSLYLGTYRLNPYQRGLHHCLLGYHTIAQVQVIHSPYKDSLEPKWNICYFCVEIMLRNVICFGRCHCNLMLSSVL